MIVFNYFFVCVFWIYTIILSQTCILHYRILTVCPFCNWIGKHILHLAQWKNLSRPPTLHIPHPSQWYWFLSSSSKRLHSRHVYLPNWQWQFWQVAWTGWRVSQRTHINSVTSFLFTVCVSCSSWQNRQVYTLLQHGVYKEKKSIYMRLDIRRKIIH